MPIRDAAAQRRNNFIIRLSDHERDMLQVVAAREQLTASETVRLLVRLAFAKIEQSWPKQKAPTNRKKKAAPKKAKAAPKKKTKKKSR